MKNKNKWELKSNSYYTATKTNGVIFDHERIPFKNKATVLGRESGIEGIPTHDKEQYPVYKTKTTQGNEF